MAVAALINAGGDSTRMGTHKALLPTPPDGRPLLAHLRDVVAQAHLAPVWVVANHAPVVAAAAQLPGVTLLADEQPGLGPLAGLVVGLAQAPEWLLMLACDLPLLRPALLRLLVETARQADAFPDRRVDAIVPVVEGRYQALCALYHRRCLPQAQAMLAAGELRVRDLFGRVAVQTVSEAELRRADPALHSFRNANTPAEWAVLCDLLHRGGG